MQLIIESPGLQIDDREQKLLYSKFENLEKLYDRITQCLVVVKKESDDRNFFYVEARLAVPQKTLFAHDQAETFKIALHKVIDDLTHQLHSYKDEREEMR